MNDSFRFEDEDEGSIEGMSYQEFLDDKNLQETLREQFGNEMVDNIIKDAQAKKIAEAHEKSKVQVEEILEQDKLQAEKDAGPHKHHGHFRLVGGPFDGGYCIPEKYPDDVKHIMAYWPNNETIEDINMDEILCRFIFNKSLPDAKEYKEYKKFLYKRTDKYDSNLDKKNDIANFILYVS